MERHAGREPTLFRKSAASSTANVKEAGLVNLGGRANGIGTLSKIGDFTLAMFAQICSDNPKQAQ